MTTLYQINEHFQDIVDRIAEAGGEISPELEKEYDDCKLSHHEKMEAYNKVIHSRQFIVDCAEAEAQRLDAEADRIRALNKPKEAEIERMKARVKEELERTGVKKVDFATGGFTVKKGSQHVEITNAEDIPDEYIEIETTRKISKTNISKAMKKGDEVKGATLITNPTTLTVR